MITPEEARIALYYYTLNDEAWARETWLAFCNHFSDISSRAEIFKQAMNDAFRFKHGKPTQFNYERTNQNAIPE